MKNYSIILLCLLLLLIPGCVQKSYTKTVVLTLKVSDIKDIKSVGIRGEGKPLSWDNDYEMKQVVKDSLYSATVTAVTGYKFEEIKFTVNGDFELKEQPDRRVVFSDKDTTYYHAVFDSNQ
jgi:putative oxidoreductase